MGLFEENLADVVFKVAESKEELEAAYTLVHSRYVCQSYMDKHPSGMRIKINYAFPDTVTFIARQGETIFSTLTLFSDSPYGLPADVIFKAEIDELRNGGKKVVEVGSFASSLQMFRLNRDMPLYMNKAMLKYAMDVLKSNDVIITINPRHVRAYEDVLLYEPKGELKYYPDVKNHPACLMHLNLDHAKEKYLKEYGRPDRKSNLFEFYFVTETLCIKLPQEKVKVWNKTLFDYFYREKTDIAEHTTKEILDLIAQDFL